MRLSFLTPLAGVFAFAAVVPLLAFFALERRARAVRRVLGLSEPGRLARVAPAAALVLVTALVALAAAQPVLDQGRTRYERTDAEAFFVFDSSRSMLAATGPAAPTRYDRALAAARELRAAIPQVPVGVASFTDRTLPHLFPTGDESVFAATLERAIGVERPPPALYFHGRATSLGALAQIPQRNYFSPTATRRLLVVFTDAETIPVDATLPRAFDRARPAIDTIFVRFWSADERIYLTGRPEQQYRPDPGSAAVVRRIASLLDGRAFDEDDLAAAAAEARARLDGREHRLRARGRERLALMPYVALATSVPLVFLLRRRNL